MAFRKIKQAFVNCSIPKELTELQQVVIEEEIGNKQVVIKEVSKEDIKSSLPDADIYTLENLIASGVNLQELPVGHILDKTDRATLDATTEQVVLDLYNKLVAEDAKVTIKAETTPTLTDTENKSNE